MSPGWGVLMGRKSSRMASIDFFILHFYPASEPKAFICSSLLGTIKGMTLVLSASGLIHFFPFYFYILMFIFKILIKADEYNDLVWVLIDERRCLIYDIDVVSLAAYLFNHDINFVTVFHVQVLRGLSLV